MDAYWGMVQRAYAHDRSGLTVEQMQRLEQDDELDLMTREAALAKLCRVTPERD